MTSSFVQVAQKPGNGSIPLLSSQVDPRSLFRYRGASPRRGLAWVLGGGGARGAAQVGVMRALLEAGIKPSTIVGTSVGALDGAVIASNPTLVGAAQLRDLWLSEAAQEVFHFHLLAAVRARFSGSLGPLSQGPVAELIRRFEANSGCATLEDLLLPLLVVATDLDAGRPVVFRSGPLAPALLASTAIPGVFAPLRIGGRDYSDGGIVDNVPIATAFREGHRRILAIGLMAIANPRATPSSWTELVARALQLSLHHRLLSDFERLRARARIVIICPVTPTDSVWRMGQSHVRSLINRAHEATARLLDRIGERLFDRSAIHYLDLSESRTTAARPGLWELKSFVTRPSRDSMSDSASETASPRIQV